MDFLICLCYMFEDVVLRPRTANSSKISMKDWASRFHIDIQATDTIAQGDARSTEIFSNFSLLYKVWRCCKFHHDWKTDSFGHSLNRSDKGGFESKIPRSMWGRDIQLNAVGASIFHSEGEVTPV